MPGTMPGRRLRGARSGPTAGAGTAGWSMLPTPWLRLDLATEHLSERRCSNWLRRTAAELDVGEVDVDELDVEWSEKSRGSVSSSAGLVGLVGSRCCSPVAVSVCVALLFSGHSAGETECRAFPSSPVLPD